MRGWGRLLRTYLLGLRGPRFTVAFRVTLATALAGFAVGLISLLAPWPWRAALLCLSGLIGLYSIARAVGLVAAQRRQHVFEPAWLAAQSDVLRTHAFEILRFTVQDLTAEGQGMRRVYNLSDPADVSALLRRQALDRSGGRLSQATAEFSYLAPAGTPTIAQAHRELPRIDFIEAGAGPGRAWIRFPEARYLGRPARGSRPARRTSWKLTGPVLILLGAPSYGDAAGSVRAP